VCQIQPWKTGLKGKEISLAVYSVDCFRSRRNKRVKLATGYSVLEVKLLVPGFTLKDITVIRRWPSTRSVWSVGLFLLLKIKSLVSKFGFQFQSFKFLKENHCEYTCIQLETPLSVFSCCVEFYLSIYETVCIL